VYLQQKLKSVIKSLSLLSCCVVIMLVSLTFTVLVTTQHVLCIGQGSYCHVYHIATNSKTAAYKIFTSTNIHGIRSGSFF